MVGDGRNGVVVEESGRGYGWVVMERSWGGQGDDGEESGRWWGDGFQLIEMRLYIWGLMSGTESSFLKGDH